MHLSLTYTILRNWKTIVVSTVCIVLLFQASVYLHPENIDWVNNDSLSISNILQFVFIDQALFEMVTVTIIFISIDRYAHLFKLESVALNPASLLVYELRFIPLFLLVFFLFAPITVSLRFLYHHFPNLSADIYFEQYFYSSKLYMSYLPFSLVVGMAAVNINLISCYQRNFNEAKRGTGKESIEKMEAFNEYGKVLIAPESIIWIERRDRKTWIETIEGASRTNETISEIAAKLSKYDFAQINRSTVVNLNQMQGYSYWEHEKYAVRMKHVDRTFTMSRKRLNEIKNRLDKSEL